MVLENDLRFFRINELLPDETSPVVWRGPVIAGVIKQFWSDVIWNEVFLIGVIAKFR